MRGTMQATAAAVMASAVLAGWSASSSAAEDWTCYTYVPNAQHVAYTGLEDLAARIEAITKGRIDVTCHTGGSLGIAASEIMAAVSDGVVQYAANPFITGDVPLAGIFSLPGLFSNEEELYKGLAIMEPYLTAQMAELGVVYLGAYNYPRQVIFSTEPIGSLADLNGKKVRVTSVEQSEFAVRFGASPVTIGTPDVASALQLGTVSVVLTAASGGARFWTDMLKANLVIGPNFTIAPVVVNQTAWETLSADEQAQVRAAVAEITKGISDFMRTDNATQEAANQAKGMAVSHGTPEDEALLVATLQDYWPQWAEERGEVAAEALAKVRAAIGK